MLFLKDIIMDEKLMTAKQVTELMHCSRGTLQRWIKESHDGRRRFPKPINAERKTKRLWRESDIARFIETGFSEAPPYDRTGEYTERTWKSQTLLNENAENTGFFDSVVWNFQP